MLKRILLRVYERTKQQTAVDSTRWICVDVIVKIPKCGILLYVTKVRTISCKVCGFSYVQMYEWALATMRCLSTVNRHDARRSPRTEVDAATLSQLQLFVDARPSPLTVEAERDMVDILARINNPAFDDLWSTARHRYVCFCVSVYFAASNALKLHYTDFCGLVGQLVVDFLQTFDLLRKLLYNFLYRMFSVV